MKFVSYKANGKTRVGIKTEQGIVDIEKTASVLAISVPLTIEEIAGSGNAGIKLLNELLTAECFFVDAEKIIYAPCVAAPEKILCAGLNYRNHIEEAFEHIPKEPVFFGKFNNALAAHKQTIQLPKTAVKFDYEAELVIVIGRQASNVPVENALSYVFGYTAGNDFSARDLQFKSGQWLIGKTCDGFAPTGPVIVTADEIDPQDLSIRCEVNGQERQMSNTNRMIFNCAEIVSYASKYMTLKAGDLIFTGTPEGVILGYPEEKQVWLKAGDTVAVEIEGIGRLENMLG